METMESMSRYLIYSTTTLVITFSLFYAYAKYKLSYWSRRGIKTPPTHLIFGNFKDAIMFKKPPADLMREIYDSADPDDPYIGFYIFHKPMILLRDHDLIKRVMVKHHDVFTNRRFGSTTGADTLGFCNLLAVKSQTWKYLRAKMTPALTGQKLKAMMPLVIKCTEPILKHIDGLPEDKNDYKEIRDVLDVSSRYVNNVLASLMYGIEENAFEVQDSDFLQAGLKVFRGFVRGVIFLIYFFIPVLIPLIQPFSKGPAKYLRKCFNESIKYREKARGMRGDLMDFLIMLKNGEQNPVFKFEGDNLLAQTISFHIAGFEANATASAWAVYELARKPEFQNVLYEEIKKYLSGKEITMELINEMTFLDCVVNETLRLHPPLPVTDRIAERDFEVEETGLVIEKGVSIYVSINATNQDPRYFNDSCEFIPLREKAENKKFYESLAFGIGPRSCIGQRLGLIIIKLMLITLVSNYTFICEKTNNEKIAVHFFKYMVDGFNLKFKKRELKSE